MSSLSRRRSLEVQQNLPLQDFKKVAEVLKKFGGLVENSGVVLKLQKVEEIGKGPLKVCREKVETVEGDEASVVLEHVEAGYQQKLVANLENIFAEEVESGKLGLEEIDAIVSELQTHLDVLREKLEDLEIKGIQPAAETLQCYEICRGILVFLKIRDSEE